MSEKDRNVFVTSATVYSENGKYVRIVVNYDNGFVEPYETNIEDIINSLNNGGIKVNYKDIEPVDKETVDRVSKGNYVRPSTTRRIKTGNGLVGIVSTVAILGSLAYAFAIMPKNPYNGQTTGTPKATMTPTPAPTATPNVTFGPSNSATVGPTLSPTLAPTTAPSKEPFTKEESNKILLAISNIKNIPISKEDFITIALLSNGIIPTKDVEYISKHGYLPLNTLYETDVPNAVIYFNKDKGKDGTRTVVTGKRKPISSRPDMILDKKGRAYLKAYVDLREALLDAIDKDKKAEAYALADKFFKLECEDFGGKRAIDTVEGKVIFSEVNPYIQNEVTELASSINAIIGAIDKNYSVDYFITDAYGKEQEQTFELAEIAAAIETRSDNANKAFKKLIDSGTYVDCSEEVKEMKEGLSK